MVLYIEYVLFDNFIMDYLILNFIEITYKYKIRRLNKIISCAIGSLLTLLLPYIYGKTFILFLYRMFIAIIMVLIIKKYKSFKDFFTYLILFFAYTFMLGGIIFGIISMFKIDYTLSGVLFYSFEFPIGIFILLIMFGVFLGKKIIKILRKQLQYGNLLYPIKVYDKDKYVEGVGFYDSGNRLNVDGNYVNIISMSLFIKLYSDMPIEKILLREIDDLNLKDPKYINIDGLKSNGSYLSFCVDKLSIGNEVFNNVRLAVTLKNFEKFDCIINSNYIN